MSSDEHSEKSEIPTKQSVLPSTAKGDETSTQELDIERYKIRFGLYKVIAGTMIVGLASVLVPAVIEFTKERDEEKRRSREADIAESTQQQEYVAKFVSQALDQDIELRIRFANYFANVAPSNFRGDWAQYKNYLEKLREEKRKEINEKERRFLVASAQEGANGEEQKASVLELERQLEWAYRELGYVAKDRSVVLSKEERRDSNASAPDSKLPADISRLVIESASDLSKVATCIAKNGITHVARYIGKASGNPRNLGASEYHALAEVSIAVIPIFETNPTAVSYFTSQKGKGDADVALKTAQEVGLSSDTVVYFAVDFDANATDHKAIVDYFQSIKNTFDASVTVGGRAPGIGVYGSGAICQLLVEKRLVSASWLAAPLAWSGSSDFGKGATWTIRQEPGRDKRLCGLEVTFNTLGAGRKSE